MSLKERPASARFIGVGDGVVDPDLGQDLGLRHFVAAEGDDFCEVGVVERFDEGGRGLVTIGDRLMTSSFDLSAILPIAFSLPAAIWGTPRPESTPVSSAG